MSASTAGVHAIVVIGYPMSPSHTQIDVRLTTVSTPPLATRKLVGSLFGKLIGSPGEAEFRCLQSVPLGPLSATAAVGIDQKIREEFLAIM